MTEANLYLKDGVNAIDIDTGVRSEAESARLIREWVDPDGYEERSRQALIYTKQLINFEQEAIDIGQWLHTL